ncbi:glycosyltransferase [Celeribacter naphthalenivorans]|uniref:glycosyltransferase n=1 Tax=Celeribacter naphthalenivorans TaxID=1614694 RepID=UPI001CFA6A74|nr:glycosyltransferase [Celeribacter naphthalenivorans]
MQKHICLVAGAMTNGGIRRVLLVLAKVFLARGHRVDLVLTNHAELTLELPDGLNVVRLGTRTRKSLPHAVRYLSENRPDAVISGRVYTDLLFLAAKLLSRQKHCRLIWTFHTEQTMELAHQSVSMKLLMRCAYRLSPLTDVCVAVSKGVARDLTRYVPKAARIEVIYNPVAPLGATPALCPDHPFWLQKDVPIMLSVGRLVPQKDHALLLKVFAELRAQRPLKLFICGDGPLRGALEILAVETGYAQDICFAGHLSDLEPYMTNADVFVSTSRWEGFSLAIAEALAAGCPVVATDCPSGPAEILDHGRLGHLVPLGDKDGLIQAISETIDAPKAASHGPETLSAYDPDRVADAYLDLMERFSKQ